MKDRLRLPERVTPRFHASAEFLEDKELGVGAFGRVVEVTHLSSGSKYALKRIDLTKLSALDCENVEKEVEVQAQLCHPNIVRLVDFFSEGSTFIMVLELSPGGNLYRYMNRRRLRDYDIKKLFRQTCVAIEYLHARGVIMRDLKPENIVLDLQMNAKLCDFGWATREDDSAYCKAKAGTFTYMSPESLSGLRQTVASDVWSLGILLYELYYNKELFEGGTCTEVLAAIDRFAVSFEPDIPPDSKALLMSLLRRDPTQRPSVKDVLRHPFFNSLFAVGYRDLPLDSSERVSRGTAQPEAHVVSDIGLSCGSDSLVSGRSSGTPFAQNSGTLSQQRDELKPTICQKNSFSSTNTFVSGQPKSIVVHYQMAGQPHRPVVESVFAAAQSPTPKQPEQRRVTVQSPQERPFFTSLFSNKSQQQRPSAQERFGLGHASKSQASVKTLSHLPRESVGAVSRNGEPRPGTATRFGSGLGQSVARAESSGRPLTASQMFQALQEGKAKIALPIHPLLERAKGSVGPASRQGLPEATHIAAAGPPRPNAHPSVFSQLGRSSQPLSRPTPKPSIFSFTQHLASKGTPPVPTAPTPGNLSKSVSSQNLTSAHFQARRPPPRASQAAGTPVGSELKEVRKFEVSQLMPDNNARTVDLYSRDFGQGRYSGLSVLISQGPEVKVPSKTEMPAMTHNSEPGAKENQNRRSTSGLKVVYKLDGGNRYSRTNVSVEPAARRKP